MELLFLLFAIIALPVFIVGFVLSLIGHVIALPFRILGLVLGGVLGLLGLIFGIVFGVLGLGFGIVGVVFGLLLLPILPIVIAVWIWRALRRRQPTPGGRTQWGMW